MRTIKHVVLAVVASVGAVYAEAADREAPVFPDFTTLTPGQEYYFYNTGAGKFLTLSADNYNVAFGDTGAKVIVTQAGENGYNVQFVSTQDYLYRSSQTDVRGNYSSASYSACNWDITLSGDTYTIQTDESSSYYNADQFLGWDGGENTMVYPNLPSTAHVSWKLVDGDAGDYYCAKLNLYSALQATDGYGYDVEKFEAVYADAESTVEELVEATNVLTSSFELTQEVEVPEWSDYPIFFENDLENPWEESNGYISGEGGKLTAKVTVDEESTFSYVVGGQILNANERLVVLVDGVPVREFWNDEQISSGHDGHRYFEKLSPGKHTIEWQWIAEGRGHSVRLEYIGVERTPSIAVSLLEPGSLGTEVLYHVNHLNDVRRLKVSGKMNDDDWAKISMMGNLYSLDLSEAETSKIPFEQFRCTDTYGDGNGDWPFFHEIKLPPTLEVIEEGAFRFTNVTDIVFPEGLQEIGRYAFQYSVVKEAFLPSTVTKIGQGAFWHCPFLESISLPEDIKEIPSRVFSDCAVLDDSLRLPEKLETVGEGAFSSPNLTITYFPESLKSIGPWAFSGIKNDTVILHSKELVFLSRSPFSNCPNLVYAELPVSWYHVDQGMFDNCNKLETVVLRSPTMVDCSNLVAESLKKQVTLKVPSYLVNSYKLDEYWYTYGNIEGFGTAEVKAWEIYQPLVLNARDRFEGCPDMSVRGSGSLKVNGDTPMAFHDLYTETNGNDNNNTATLLSNCGDMEIQGDYVHGYYVSGNKWYFISLPFDFKVSEIEHASDVQMAVRYYDGSLRAADGAGNSWKDYDADTVITAGTGFILQANKDAWLNFHALDNETKQYVVAYKEFAKALEAHPSETASDQGWNLVGNPYQTFYNINHINFTAPITVWNVSAQRYDAYSIIDDEYALMPNQAFFVQCPEEVSSLSFPLEGRQVTSEIGTQQVNVRPALRGMPLPRRLIDLELQAGDKSDHTRVVFNAERTEGYDMACDASKFMSMDQSVPQVYSLDADGTTYAINERPVSDGRVMLGFYAPQDGAYTFALSRGDGDKVWLIDHQTGSETDLSTGEYHFTAEAGQDDARFELKVEVGGETGIGTAASAKMSVKAVDGGLCLENATGSVKVYTPDGRLAHEGTADGGSYRVSLSRGIYLVHAAGQVVKIVVD
ncbi:leucine-rich repeat domain-containing protein [Paraprevotella clara]|uniref:Uncharacterized protein n=1 Tax=Paraprevotella clara YIT 11840 TaxID=762968 RepID=G5SWM8_9BACT|nr:leucine-rich repeat domain-containing protein [Paraprevotella clara]EHG98259.1 hypothetical protein HMPREF9441_03801 [Paraprevotella clara YIT 11840]